MSAVVSVCCHPYTAGSRQLILCLVSCMSNGPHRAQFWAEFIPSHCQFPDAALLRTHFAAGSFGEFCDCGCNSFRVVIPAEMSLQPLIAADDSRRGHVAFFECDFRLADSDRTLEIILFADARGYVDYVEVDSCANSYPVPEVIRVQEPPYHVHPAATQCT